VLPHYDVCEGQGPYLLLVHGMLSSRAQWGPNLAALAKVCRPVRLELYGHGRSASPEALEDHHPDRYVEAFERIREELGAERWMVCGQSLGGALTLRYALAHPERVQAQLLTNSASALSGPEWGARLLEPMQALLRAVEHEGRAALERMPVHPARARSLAPEVKAALVADAALHDPRGVGRCGLGTVVHATLGDRLGENRVPALLVCGRRETRFQPLREAAARLMAGLEIADLDGGHSVNLDAAPDFDRVAAAFISKHAAR
jgi:2-succinyl-6-hydroxy-2,4-cyclohexadiene-1-carboxylate synthase